MQRRALGSSGFEISTIGIGTWATGGWMWGGQDDDASVQAIHAAVDHGVNWIDTAPIYGSGHSEAVVGRALRELPAARRPLVFTKFGLGDDSEASRRARRRARRRAAPSATPACSASASTPSISTSCTGRRAADRRDGGRLRRAAEGRQDPRDRRVELLGRAARGVARHRRAAPLGAVALQHPPAGHRRRRPALRGHDQSRRDRLLAAVPRHALRHLEEGQDLRRRRYSRRAQGLPGRPLRAPPRRHRRRPRARRRQRRSARAQLVRRRAAATRPA